MKNAGKRVHVFGRDSLNDPVCIFHEGTLKKSDGMIEKCYMMGGTEGFLKVLKF